MEFFSTHLLNGLYTWASSEVFDIIGYTDKEIIGKNPYDYFFPDDHPRILKKHVASTGKFVNDTNEPKVETLVYRTRHKNGNYVWVRTKFIKCSDSLICFTNKLSFFDIFYNKFLHKKTNQIIIEI